MNLRKAAQGRPCQIRIPGVCIGDDATTVLCHYRMPGLNGVGMKPPDLIGAIGCHACHAVVDRREQTDLEAEWVKLCFAEGVLRTQALWIREGLV